MRPSPLAERSRPLRTNLPSIDAPTFAYRDRSPPGRLMRTSTLVDWPRPVRMELSSIPPPPFPDRNRPQPVGSVLLVLDFLQTPVGSAAPIPSIPLVDQQSYH